MKIFISENLIVPEKSLNVYTTNNQAIQINKIIKMYSTKDDIITDATACIGGNSVFFIKEFKKVNMVEQDYNNFNILKQNVKSTYYKNYIYNCSYNTIKFILKQDIIYIDPPWGGESYKSKKKVDLFLDSIDVIDIINNLYNYTRIVALKVPINFNINKLNNNFWLFKFYNIYKSKRCIYKLIIFYKCT